MFVSALGLWCDAMSVPRYRADQARLRQALALTVVIVVGQALGAWYSGSLALLSDTGHVLTDSLAIGAALLALHIAARPLRPGSRFTYGLHRIEVVVALGSALLLLGVCGWIVWQAVHRLFVPRQVLVEPMLGVALLGLLGNVAVALLLHHGESLSVRAAYLHALSDAVSSVAVIGAALGVWWTGALWLDPVLSLVLVGFIARQALLLLWEALSVVLEMSPKTVPVLELEAVLRQLPGVQDVHDLHVWRITPVESLLSAHLVARPGADRDELLAQARALLEERFGIAHVSLQVEPPEFVHTWQCHRCPYSPGAIPPSVIKS